MATFEATQLSTGHQLLECPRWHGGSLWLSDFFSKEVMTFDVSGNRTVVTRVEGMPAGLGFLPDGTPLVVSQDENRIYRILPDGGLELHADYSHLATGDGNDMLVDARGNAYVGNFGFRPGLEEPRTAVVALVTPDGSVRVAASDLWFPNGTVLMPDGKSLLIAESFGHRITAFDIGTDGVLVNRRVWAQLPDTHAPDGIALDTDGGCWFGNPMSDTHSGFFRVEEGGEITDEVPTPGTWAIACAFGGNDLSTFFMTCANTTLEDHAQHKSSSYLATAYVKRTGVSSA